MFGTLFIKECRQVLKSLVYYIYVVIFVLFITSQMSGEDELREPQPGWSYYGETVTQDDDLIMEGTLAHLIQEVGRNSFTTYPIGFYKEVNLTDGEIEQVKAILERCTGRSFEVLDEEMEQQFIQNSVGGASYQAAVKEGLTYAEFEAAMEEVCDLVGKGSFYEKGNYENSISVPMTYEQAKEEFDALSTKDGLTRAYMRLFCDYAGIILSVLPIFIGVSRALRDKRAKVQQVIFSKSASGIQIIVSRYLANLVMISIPVFLTALLLQQPFYYRAQTMGIQGDIWAFLTVPGIWLLPEIMTVLAVSFLITEFTDTIWTIFLQVAWAFTSLISATTLVGDFGLKLVARWNTLGRTLLYFSLEKELFFNRGFYFLLAAVCVILTVLVYEKKRRGGESVHEKLRKFDK
ncbi:MAG: hypothetical protein K2K20_05590 [Lachnospiraceae bacterium]|nr:hypothetical protein [Lachnospiraceae bacterium]